MKLAKRLLLGFALLVVLLLAASYWLVIPGARLAVERGGRYALGVETTLDEVVLRPRFGRSVLGFSGLEVGNPEGISGEPFLTIGRFQVVLRTSSLISGALQVPEIELEQLHLRLIQDAGRSNFKEIRDHIGRLGASGAPSEPASPEAEAGGGPALDLGRVRVQGVAATLELRGIGGLDPLSETFHLPDFELDLGALLGGGGASGQGANVGDLTAALVDELLALALREAERHVDPKVMEMLQVIALLESDLAGALVGELESELESIAEELPLEFDASQYDQAREHLKGLLGDD
jgi:hypothetical protein